MHLEKYEYKTNERFADYEFFSDGPNGRIKKVVNYKQYDYLPNGTPLINLAFGDWDEERQEINDSTISNNNDRNKILATVASTIIAYTNKYGKVPIYVEGRTAARTRLYQMGVNAHKKEVEELFTIMGRKRIGVTTEWEKFQSGINYEAFFVLRK